MQSKNEILGELWKSRFVDDLIWTITSGHQLKDDLKAELFLILCEMSESRIRKAYEDKYLNYLCINILKKQYHSNTSPFHKRWRKDKSDNEFNINLEDEVITTIDDNVLEHILWFVNNKLDLTDRELFKMYYKLDRYDRWLGDLKDITCNKSTSSLHKVSRKLSIKTKEGKNITIGYESIRLSLKRSIMLIKHYLIQNGLHDDYFNN